MNDISVLSDSSIKDLGIPFDEHISKCTSTVNSRLGIIRNTFHIIDKEGSLILCKSNVRPILEYGISVWFLCFCLNIPQDPSRVLCGRDARY